MWTSLAADFPRQPVLNRGFGGSQLRDAIWHADQVAVRYQPRRIVLYAGDNDIDAGRTPEQVRDDFRAFVARIRRDLPDEIGRASCRERVCQYVSISVVAVTLKKKTNRNETLKMNTYFIKKNKKLKNI